MSKLNIDQKSVYSLLSEKHSDFLIPDYQRPYAWSEDESQTLWDDLFEFAFPESNYENFDADKDEYFLGPIVTFRNQDKKLEVIDGQQRLTTLLLLLRAFYDKFSFMKDEQSQDTHAAIARCVWKTNEFGKPDRKKLKINSEVASDAHKKEFLEILSSGKVDSSCRSNYAQNYLFFQKKINQLVNEYPSYTPYFATRIMNNVILLPIEAESQTSALRIFSTLNDRGLPLSDADIFKSQFYKFFQDSGKKEEFIRRWKRLEDVVSTIFVSGRTSPMDELFTRYMYFERAKQSIKLTTTRAVRDFYSDNNYALLKNEQTFKNLEKLAEFWQRVVNQDPRFSEEILKQLYILNNAPNGMWTYLTSVYFLAKSDSNGDLQQDEFLFFLKQIIAFIFAYAIHSPGVNALRTPIYPAMVDLVNGSCLSFEKHKFKEDEIRAKFDSFSFSSNRPVTKSILVWWSFLHSAQPLLKASEPMQIEHIYARSRAQKEPLKQENLVESIGNKSILESSVNIRSSDYRFSDKTRYYQGFTYPNGGRKEGTRVQELLELSHTKKDFCEEDIIQREKTIINSFLKYLKQFDLLAFS